MEKTNSQKKGSENRVLEREAEAEVKVKVGRKGRGRRREAAADTGSRDAKH